MFANELTSKPAWFRKNAITTRLLQACRDRRLSETRLDKMRFVRHESANGNLPASRPASQPDWRWRRAASVHHLLRPHNTTYVRHAAAANLLIKLDGKFRFTLHCTYRLSPIANLPRCQYLFLLLRSPYFPDSVPAGVVARCNSNGYVCAYAQLSFGFHICYKTG